MKKAKRKPQDLTTRNARSYNRRLKALEIALENLVRRITNIEAILGGAIRVGADFYQWSATAIEQQAGKVKKAKK